MRVHSCYLCNTPVPDGVVNFHHKVPRSAGGSDSPSNLVPLCPTCHTLLHRYANNPQIPVPPGVNTMRLKDLARSVVVSMAGRKDVQHVIHLEVPSEIWYPLQEVARSQGMGVHPFVRSLILREIQRKGEL